MLLVHFTHGWVVWHSLAGFCGRNASAGEVSDDINKKVCWIISIWRWRLCTSAPETPSFPPEWRNLTQLLAGGRHPDKYTTIVLLIYTKYLGLHDTNKQCINTYTCRYTYEPFSQSQNDNPESELPVGSVSTCSGCNAMLTVAVVRG